VDTPYQRFAEGELILRDELAIDRTLLANERTLLAYLRGGVALFLAGVTFVHFSERGWYTVLGLVCLPSALAIVALGWRRFRRMDLAIKLIRERTLRLG
jgi:putative membrane protein